jgi:hypothetical protein
MYENQRKHIVPVFGNTPLDVLDYSRIKSWIIRMSGKYSKDTVRLMIATLRVMLQEAVNEGILASNHVTKFGRFKTGDVPRIWFRLCGMN